MHADTNGAFLSSAVLAKITQRGEKFLILCSSEVDLVACGNVARR